MRYYYRRRGKGKIGRTTDWLVTDKYESKAALKRAHEWDRRATIVDIYTEEQLREIWKQAFDVIVAQAKER